MDMDMDMDMKVTTFRTLPVALHFTSLPGSEMWRERWSSVTQRNGSDRSIDRHVNIQACRVRERQLIVFRRARLETETETEVRKARHSHSSCCSKVGLSAGASGQEGDF